MASTAKALVLVSLSMFGCKLDSLHDEAWEAKDEFELTFCDCRAETEELFDSCLYGYGWFLDPDTRAFQRECEAELDDERKHRKAAKAYYECKLEHFERGLACLDDNPCDSKGPCNVSVAAQECRWTEQTSDFTMAARACAYKREQEALLQR